MAITAEWIINKAKKKIYAISHAKAVVRGNSTVDADLSTIEQRIEEINDLYGDTESLYSKTTINIGRKVDTVVGKYSVAEGFNTTASGDYSHAEGFNTTASGTNSHAEGGGTTASKPNSHAEGFNTTASGSYSHAEGLYTTASGTNSHAEGFNTTASNFASHVGGKYNSPMEEGEINGGTQIGDVLILGNGTSDDSLSNALRVTYTGAVYGKSAFNSSGADYAEFIKPWADNNEDNEDRVGYFVTIKEDGLHKANKGEYIVGITSGNPSIVGNADEDYYWMYERDEFNRVIMEDVEEEIQSTDEEGNLLFDEETNEPIMEKTGNIIKNARCKISKDYDSSLQKDYVERKNRKEWDYVGMLGVLPVRDDGTCSVGGFCKCGVDGIGTSSDTEGYFVIERINDNTVSVILK